MPPLARTILLIGLLCLTGLTATPASAQISEKLREALQPKNQRWQYYPPQVERVVFTPAGKPWFQLDTAQTVPSTRQIKRMVERGASPDRAVGWVENVHILLIDSRGRIWLRVRPDGERHYLLRYDPEADQWLRNTELYDGVQALETMYESADGTIFIADQGRMHVVRDGEWSKASLYDLAAPRGPERPMTSSNAHFAEDEHGRVYVWRNRGRAKSEFTLGYFIWSDGNWRRRLLRYTEMAADAADTAWREQDDAQAVRHGVRALVPLTDGRVFVSTYQGVSYIDRPFPDSKAGENVDLPRDIQTRVPRLNAADWRTRERATLELRALGPSRIPELQSVLQSAASAEVRHRIRGVITQLHEQRKGEPFDFEPPRVNGAVINSADLEGIDQSGHAWLSIESVKKPAMTEPVRRHMWRMTRDGRLLPVSDEAAHMFVRSFYAAPDGRVFLSALNYRDRENVLLEDGRALPLTAPARHANDFYDISQAGRMFVRREGFVAAYNADAPDRRKTLPTKQYTVSNDDNAVAFGPDGALWADMPNDEGKLVLHEYRNGQWHANDPRPPRAYDDHIYFIKAMDNGMLIMEPRGRATAFLYDGGQWHQYETLRALVEQHYELIVAHIDDRGDDHRLRIDRADRIWLKVTPPFVVFDGTRWIEHKRSSLPGSLRGMRGGLVAPMPGGDGMLAMHVPRIGLSNQTIELMRWRLNDAGQFDAKKLKLPDGVRLKSDYKGPAQTWRDSRGRVRIIVSGMADTPVMVDAQGVHAINDIGRPRFEDSRGGIWFIRDKYPMPAGKRRLVLLDPDGRRATLAIPYLWRRSHVREDAHGRIWVTSDRGLFQIAVHRDEKTLRLEKVALYERGALQDSVHDMTIHNNTLWLFHHTFWGNGTPRLTRVQLPPPPRNADP